MTDLMADGSAALSGVIVSAAALITLAGGGKVLGAARGAERGSAIRRLLRAGPLRWRLTEASTGTVECATGIAVCAGISPVLSGSAMAGLGAVFVALLGVVRRSGVPGGCGCLGWRRAEQESVSVRAIARAGWVLAAGVLEAATQHSGLPPLGQVPFYAGAAGGSSILLLTGLPVSMLPCRWHWRPARRSLALLARHPVFEAMTSPFGLWGLEYAYRRVGCMEEFWLPVSADANGSGQGVVVFRVNRADSGQLSVHASTGATMPEGVRRRSWPGMPNSLEKPTTIPSVLAS